MKKLKLNLEDFELESFETMMPKETAKGTVDGLEASDDWSWEWTVCLSGCNGTWGMSCDCSGSGDWSYRTCMTAADSPCTME